MLLEITIHRIGRTVVLAQQVKRFLWFAARRADRPVTWCDWTLLTTETNRTSVLWSDFHCQHTCCSHHIRQTANQKRTTQKTNNPARTAPRLTGAKGRRQRNKQAMRLKSGKPFAQKTEATPLQAACYSRVKACTQQKPLSTARRNRKPPRTSWTPLSLVAWNKKRLRRKNTLRGTTSLGDVLYIMTNLIYRKKFLSVPFSKRHAFACSNPHLFY